MVFVCPFSKVAEQLPGKKLPKNVEVPLFGTK